MEVVPEIMEGCVEAGEAATEAMEVSVEASEVGAEVIDIGAEFESSLAETSSDVFGDLVSEDSALEGNIEVDTDSSVSESAASAESAGAAPDEVASEVGSDFSQASAEQQAGVDANAARPGVWGRICKGLKIAGYVLLAEFIGRQIYDIVAAINDASKNPPWKGSLTEEQKEQLKKLMDASQELDPLMKSLDKAVQPLQKNPYGDYGTLEVHMGSKTKVVNVIDVVGYIIQDALRQIDQANDSLKNGIDGLSVSDLTQLCNFVFTVFVDAQSLINLRDNKGNKVKNDQLGSFKFPNPSVDKRVNTVLTSCFPSWKDRVKSQANNLAQYGASVAISAFVKSQVIMKVNDFLEANVYPKIKDAAKAAGSEAAKAYVQSKKGAIIARALIPIVGTEKAREYGKEVQKEAIKKAQEAAQQAGKAKAEELKDSIQGQLKAAVQGMLGDNKDAMKEIGLYAAKEILGTVTSPAS